MNSGLSSLQNETQLSTNFGIMCCSVCTTIIKTPNDGTASVIMFFDSSSGATETLRIYVKETCLALAETLWLFSPLFSNT